MAFNKRLKYCKPENTKSYINVESRFLPRNTRTYPKPSFTSELVGIVRFSCWKTSMTGIHKLAVHQLNPCSFLTFCGPQNSPISWVLCSRLKVCLRRLTKGNNECKKIFFVKTLNFTIVTSIMTNAFAGTEGGVIWIRVGPFPKYLLRKKIQLTLPSISFDICSDTKRSMLILFNSAV